MSEQMLHAVLEMPPELWDGGEIDVLQRHGRYKEASTLIENLMCNNVECHQGLDILASLYKAHNQIPCCGLLAIIGAAIQEIQAYRDNKQDSHEWECPECGAVGNYADLRSPFDSGVDSCPDCGFEVKDSEE
jgi:predicted RNA-binding Zn-ribbon protein involved in translation (DUF1610 family)